MKNLNYLFIYGSLRQGFNSPAFEYIYKYYSLVGTAKTKGIMVDLGTYPAVVPTTEEKYITGELYKIKNERELQWALVQLDDYEGVLVEAHETPDYIRSTTTVLINNETIEANVYWYNKQITGLPIVASGDIFQFIKMKG